MGKQHFGCKIKMSVRFGRPAELLARTAMMVVVASLSGKVVGSLITESAYTYYIRLTFKLREPS